ncbi:MAG: hypothetical protein J0I21_21390 [Alphaproteobacteria bacterium]|nr:hypothetical protein [Alphaproteobacteria bacterium]
MPALAARRAVLLAALAGSLAACETPAPPQSFAPLSYDYLTKLRLRVVTIDIDDAYTAATVANGEHMEAQAPESPAAALRRMAQDRLVAGGEGGHAVFTIQDAALVRIGDRYEADFAVHLDVTSADGTRSGYASARVTRTRQISDYTPEGTRRELYALTKAAMDDMNVEFEYQVRKSLRDYLMSPGDAPAPVEQQDLGSPPKS